MSLPILRVTQLESRLTPAGQFAAALDNGSQPIVNVYDATGFLYSVTAYNPAFRGGVRVAMGDVNGDGVDDLVTAAGEGGGPHVRVFDGVSHSVINEFMAYDPAFTGGVYVAIGDVNGDAAVDIVTGPGAGGGPHVKAFTASNGNVISNFFAYDSAFRGGISVAAGDVVADGAAEIITGPGRWGGPHVRVFNSLGVVLTEFQAYEPNYFGGIYVSAGNIDGAGKEEIITGTCIGGGPYIKAFDGTTGLMSTNFFAYNASSRGGATVASTDLNNDGTAEIITGPGPGGGSLIREWAFDPSGPTPMTEFYAFNQLQMLGVYVG